MRSCALRKKVLCSFKNSKQKMWGADFQVNVVTVFWFCVSAVVVFIVSLTLIMGAVFIKRASKGTKKKIQSQGIPNSVIYTPTTVQNDSHLVPDVKRPLVPEENKHLYPVQELAPLRMQDE